MAKVTLAAIAFVFCAGAALVVYLFLTEREYNENMEHAVNMAALRCLTNYAYSEEEDERVRRAVSKLHDLGLSWSKAIDLFTLSGCPRDK